MTKNVKIISIAERAAWEAEHADGGLPSQSWSYAWGLCASGADPKLAVVRAGGVRMLLPFVERHWQGTTDVATILGFSGASITPDSGEPLLLWRDFATAQGWVTGYIQLALSVNLAGKPCGGPVIVNNAAFLLDLREPLDLASFSQAIQRKIRRVEKSGAVLVDDRLALMQALRELYPQAMERLGAAPRFRFAPETLDRWAGSGAAMMLGARLNGRIEAVYLCLVAGSHAEFHLFGCTESGRGLSAWLIWHGIAWLRERGVTCLNLTGGMRPGDGLYRFKAGFNGVPTPRQAVHQIYDAARYAELCRQAGATADPGWFPAYRASESGGREQKGETAGER